MFPQSLFLGPLDLISTAHNTSCVSFFRVHSCFSHVATRICNPQWLQTRTRNGNRTTSQHYLFLFQKTLSFLIIPIPHDPTCVCRIGVAQWRSGQRRSKGDAEAIWRLKQATVEQGQRFNPTQAPDLLLGGCSDYVSLVGWRCEEVIRQGKWALAERMVVRAHADACLHRRLWQWSIDESISLTA